MEANLTIAALLAQGSQRLHAVAGDPASALREAEMLLGHELGAGRAQLRSQAARLAGNAAAGRFAQSIARRARGEPVAYIVGRREFWSLQLSVSPAVLVPRADTELLVERALALWPHSPARIADLGTGSGAVAIAIASERPRWHVTATDLSADALAMARANAASLGQDRLEFVAGDWFAPLAGRRFELVVSNPPYVADDDPALRQSDLRFEPTLALRGGPDGLSCLRAIIEAAPGYLEPDGWLLLEHGSQQAAAIRHELVVRGFASVRSHRDLAGHERVTEARAANCLRFNDFASTG